MRMLAKEFFAGSSYEKRFASIFQAEDSGPDQVKPTFGYICLD
jgi:hypothetical protein